MTEATNDLDQDDLPQVDELTLLKQRATTLGVKFHSSISVEKLREKVNAAITGEPEEVKEEVKPKEDEQLSRREAALAATKLVRIRVTCMNPAKREWAGELFTAGNGLVKTTTKFVPFNNDEGWHVPQIILNVMKDRQCQIFVAKKLPNGTEARVGKMIKEFAIEELPPLTQKELDELARRQAIAKSVD